MTDFDDPVIAASYAERLVAEELTLKPVVAALLGDGPGRALDLGCGDGQYSVLLAERGYDVLAIDRSPHMLALARAHHDRPAVIYRAGDARRTGEPDGSFDLILMNMVVPDVTLGTLDGILAEAARVLKQRGRIVLSTLHEQYVLAEQDATDRPLDFDSARFDEDGHTYRAEARTTTGETLQFTETHVRHATLVSLLDRHGLRIREERPGLTLPAEGIRAPKYLVLSTSLKNR